MGRYRLSDGHVLWAYNRTVWRLYGEGKSVKEIRAWLREEVRLAVGEPAIRAVLAAGKPVGYYGPERES